MLSAAASAGGSAAAAAASRGLAGLPLVAAAAARKPPPSLLPAAAAALKQAPFAGSWGAASVRGYAQVARLPRAGVTAPVEMQKNMHLRLSQVSPNLLAEPYRGQPPPLPAAAYFRPSGWKELWRRFLGSVKSLYTLARCK
jgi:large subunit ribosomal protein L45